MHDSTAAEIKVAIVRPGGTLAVTSAPVAPSVVSQGVIVSFAPYTVSPLSVITSLDLPEISIDIPIAKKARNAKDPVATNAPIATDAPITTDAPIVPDSSATTTEEISSDSLTIATYASPINTRISGGSTNP